VHPDLWKALPTLEQRQIVVLGCRCTIQAGQYLSSWPGNLTASSSSQQGHQQAAGHSSSEGVQVQLTDC